MATCWVTLPGAQPGGNAPAPSDEEWTGPRPRVLCFLGSLIVMLVSCNRHNSPCSSFDVPWLSMATVSRFSSDIYSYDRLISG